MKIEYFHVDAFADRVFTGNPAGVCLLENGLSAEIMQKIAFENNLSETAFVVPSGEDYEIRWFTPLVEVDLCGHATLASAHVLFSQKNVSRNPIEFQSVSGMLAVSRQKELLYLDFPSRPAVSCPVPPGLDMALNQRPLEVLSSVRDYLVVLESEEEVRACRPNMELLKKIDKFGFIITAAGKSVDFVSRFFCPAEGIPEDPVTGSSHCTLVPYWSQKLRRVELKALQVSARGGRLHCRDHGERVEIGGGAVIYSRGWIEI